MIRLTLTEVMNVGPALQQLAEKSFPGATTFKIARLIREINKEINTFEDGRLQIINKYGIKKENGEIEVQENGNVKIAPENIGECNKELSELLSTEVDINAEKLDISAFEKIELTPTMALAIEPIIKENPLV